jgi:hypothetical protein
MTQVANKVAKPYIAEQRTGPCKIDVRISSSCLPKHVAASLIQHVQSQANSKDSCMLLISLMPICEKQASQ